MPHYAGRHVIKQVASFSLQNQSCQCFVFFPKFSQQLRESSAFCLEKVQGRETDFFRSQKSVDFIKALYDPGSQSGSQQVRYRECFNHGRVQTSDTSLCCSVTHLAAFNREIIRASRTSITENLN